MKFLLISLITGVLAEDPQLALGYSPCGQDSQLAPYCCDKIPYVSTFWRNCRPLTQDLGAACASTAGSGVEAVCCSLSEMPWVKIRNCRTL